MHSLEALELYTQFHPRWFEGVGNYVPESEYIDAVSEVIPDFWQLTRNGLWYSANPPGITLPEHGWKLHISVSSRDSVAALRKAAPVLKDEAAAFKFLLDRRITSLVNGKLWPRGSSGKFITIFPATLEQFFRLGSRLSQELASFIGPYILSDRRWPGSMSVYYRYGGFVSRTTIQADGTRRHVLVCPNGETVPDVRVPYWNPPEWARDPFPEEKQPTSITRALSDGRFSIKSALSFSNRGGVYKAIDNETGREVVLKEARPHIELGTSRLEAIAVLEKEYRLLERLAGTGYFVRPATLFRAWEHAFLVEEFAPGVHMGLFSLRGNPIYSGKVSATALDSYYDQMRHVWLQLARAITAAHDRGIVLGDLSFTNILVSEGGNIRICDLETAAEEGVDSPLGLHTPGMSVAGIGDRANDFYSLGALIFGSMMLVHGLTGFHAPFRRRFLDELTADLAVPAELGTLIDDLMERSEDCCAAPRLTCAAIERLPFGNSTAWLRAPRLGQKMLQRFNPQRRRELRSRVQDAVGGITRYLLGTADTSREDRLFPADLFVFETNPLSVAFGAMGVLYSLDHLTGGVPANLIDWVLRRRVTNEDYPPGLYLGQAGIAWVLNELGHNELAVRIMRTARQHPALWYLASNLHGAAGYGLACLKLWLRGAGDEFLTEACRIGEHLAASCVRDDRGARWPNENGSVYLGYAHGGSGIALFLLYLALATRDSVPLLLGRQALRFELAQGVWLDGEFAGFPAQLPGPSQPPAEAAALSCYWDAGSAGIGTVLVRYSSVASDAEDQSWLARLAADASRKYTAFPQLFRGLAGLGNFLLDVWLHTGDQEHLSAAWHVAEGILLFGIERDEGLAFPGDQARRESADFATGAAGVGLFLDRLLKAEREKAPNFNFVVDELLPFGLQ